jgi:hypothetical protein
MRANKKTRNWERWFPGALVFASKSCSYPLIPALDVQNSTFLERLTEFSTYLSNPNLRPEHKALESQIIYLAGLGPTDRRSIRKRV